LFHLVEKVVKWSSSTKVYKGTSIFPTNETNVDEATRRNIETVHCVGVGVQRDGQPQNVDVNMCIEVNKPIQYNTRINAEHTTQIEGSCGVKIYQCSSDATVNVDGGTKGHYTSAQSLEDYSNEIWVCGTSTVFGN